MRFAWTIVFSLTVMGCSSEESKPAGPVDRKYVCVAAGGYCAQNIPYTCNAGYEAATDNDRKDSCGKSVDDVPRDVPCCLPVAEPPDTGAPDTGAADAAGDATSDSTSDAVSDAPGDSASDALPDVAIDVSVDGG